MTNGIKAVNVSSTSSCLVADGTLSLQGRQPVQTRARRERMDEDDIKVLSEASDSIPVLPDYRPFTDKDGSPAPDIILRTSDNCDFYCHRLLLSLSSSVFASMCSLPQNGEDLAQIPVVSVSEEAHALFSVLSICDPRCRPGLPENLDQISSTLNVADKYEMTGVIQTIGNMLKLMQNVIQEQPLRVYAIAIRYHLQDVVVTAARGTLCVPVDEWPDVPELKQIPASALQKLYQYYFACMKVSTALATNLSWLEDANYVWMRMEGYHTGGCTAMYRSDMNARCAEWWLRYLVKLAEQLGRTPGTLGPSLLSTGLTAAKTALECANCRFLAHQDLHRFNQRLTAKVEEVINKIEPPKWDCETENVL